MSDGALIARTDAFVKLMSQPNVPIEAQCPTCGAAVSGTQDDFLVSHQCCENSTRQICTFCCELVTSPEAHFLDRYTESKQVAQFLACPRGSRNFYWRAYLHLNEDREAIGGSFTSPVDENKQRRCVRWRVQVSRCLGSLLADAARRSSSNLLRLAVMRLSHEQRQSMFRKKASLPLVQQFLVQISKSCSGITCAGSSGGGSGGGITMHGGGSGGNGDMEAAAAIAAGIEGITLTDGDQQGAPTFVTTKGMNGFITAALAAQKGGEHSMTTSLVGTAEGTGFVASTHRRLLLL